LTLDLRRSCFKAIVIITHLSWSQWRGVVSVAVGVLQYGVVATARVWLELCTATANLALRSRAPSAAFAEAAEYFGPW